MSLASGCQLGTYEILCPLGAGGMGEVYRARDTRLGREVALKVLPEAFAHDSDRLARLQREARTMAGLNHPNIVVLYSIEEEDGVCFLTMELVEGRNLAEEIPPGGLPMARLLDFGIALADALVAAHEKGIVHRDFKPGNVMVTRNGRVKVLDFGLAKVEPPVSGPVATQAPTRAAQAVPVSVSGQVFGTVPYMAPEQIRGEAVDARTDLFALGIVLYELAAGRRPFTGATAADVSSAILRDTPEPLTRVRPEIPLDFERIVMRCLEKNALERVQTALEVCNELHRLKQGDVRGSPRERALQGVASIAVMPFVNRSRDEADEFFSDGLADELLAVLAKMPRLKVVARTSSFHFKGSNATIAEIGGALNVATVLEGSVRKSGNRVRVSVQLVKVLGGYHLWSQTYDRTLDDILAVQDDIATSVVRELRTTLVGEDADSRTSGEVMADVATAAKGRGRNPEAHRLYLQARYFLERRTPEDVTKGIAYLEESVALDPANALAWAELGGAYSTETELPEVEGYRRARVAVDRALELEPGLAEGHAQLAGIQIFHDWNWHAAAASIRRALQLAPGNALVLRRAGLLSVIQGRVAEGLELTGRAVERDPLSASAYSHYAMALHAANRLEEAEKACRKALELAPQRRGTHAGLTTFLLAQGRIEEALAESMLEQNEAARLWALAIVNFVAGNQAESSEALNELCRKYAEPEACRIAEVHAVRGEVDAAFEWLERAYAQHDAGLIGIEATGRFDTLRADPRWGHFVRRMGLAD